MNWKRRIVETRCAGCIGGVLAAVLGLVLWATPLGQWLVCLSYDLPFLFGPDVTFTNTVLVYMDEESRAKLGQSYKDWDRTWHAHLVNRMTEDHARLVVLDIYLTEKGQPEANVALSNAIATNGNVVLAADIVEVSEGEFVRRTALPPLKPFEEAAQAWGIARLLLSSASTVRQIYPSTEGFTNLPWAAASAANAPAAQAPPESSAGHWINYYTPASRIPELQYCNVTNQPPGYFRDKYVFIGGQPNFGFQTDQVDEFSTPRRLWGVRRSPGMEIQATAFLNLLRDDPLTRTPAWAEFWILLGSGLLAGFGLALVRPLPATGLALVLAGGVAALAIVLFWQRLVWFPWTVIVAVQIPCALAWSVLLFTRRLQKTLTQLGGAPRDRQNTTVHPGLPPRPEPANWPKPVDQTTESPTPPKIPNYTLKRLIGEGAYGQVWLAQDLISTYHAVKIIKRSKFEDDRPYEREFMGMKRFTPISRDHPGLVQVLHVGMDEENGCFFYVMEAADDAETGRAINPDRYVPKDLAKVLRARGRLPIRECLELCVPLASALAFLHERQLIHRDVKPSNIIFVNHTPKIADIGLVTQVNPDSTYVGTQEYIPPRGYGLPSADCFALGKVMYLVSFGSLGQFSALPTDLDIRADREAMLALNEIILRACDDEPKKRYPSARELHAELQALQARLGGTERRSPELH